MTHTKHFTIITSCIIIINSLLLIALPETSSAETYTKTKLPTQTTTKYNMVIIAPKKYSKPLKPLIQHKNAHGIKTKFYSLQSISTLFNGRDLQEKIKHFIKFALENWQTKYVLLVGDVNEIPVRYLWNEDYGRFVFPDRYYSDLYYADIFDKHGNYVSWDSNNNNKFGEWWHNGRDQLDLHPDVYLGRLPCRNIFEVKNIVKKIINYETNTHKQPWFKKILVTGGDWIGETPGLNDADFLAEEVAKMMENKGFKAVRLYASLHNLTTKNIHTAINSGVGFIFFAPGDGLRTKWSTFINESNPVEFSVPNIKLLNNHEKLPIVVVGGCMANDIDPRGGYPTPLQQGECWGWTFVKKRNGGAIATVGSTGGCFYRNTSDFFALLEKTFFETYCKENITHLGELWGKTISNYLNISPVRWNNGETEPDGMNCKDIQMFSLIGDPSLRIGGYLYHDNPQKTKQINYTSTTKKTKQPYSVNEKKCEKEKHVETEITKTIKNHPPLNTHPPIYIEGNKDFTTENGVTSGSGSASDPYIIKKWIIDASTTTGIVIKNVTTHFIIKDCIIYGGKYTNKPPGFLNDGIQIINAENGNIQKCILIENGVGIKLKHTRNIAVEDVEISNNDFGLLIIKSSQINIKKSNINDNIDNIKIIASNSLSISECSIDSGFLSGIRAAYSSSIKIKNCTITDTKHLPRPIGIILYSSTHSIISDCIIKGFSYYGIVFSEGFNSKPFQNLVINCDISKCTFSGIAIYGVSNDVSQENKIVCCHIHKNIVGISIFKAKENHITYCAIYNNNIGINILNPKPSPKRNYIINNNIYQNEKGILGLLTHADMRHNWWGSVFGPSITSIQAKLTGGDRITLLLSHTRYRPYSLKPHKI